jgi:hypothetical protein
LVSFIEFSQNILFLISDAAKGAKMGAAVGATAGGMQGLGARRRARLRR